MIVCAISIGGFIIYGISESDGIPVSLNGFQISNIDEEVRRLEDMIRSGIEPRIPGALVKEIPLTSGFAIIISIPKSFALPHMVKFNNSSRFYSRNSKSSYQLEVSEIRSLFLQSEQLTTHIKNFRTERISKIIANDTPVIMEDSAKVVLHIIPLNSFDPTKIYEFDNIIRNSSISLAPISTSSYDVRYNFDGYLSYSQSSRTNKSHSYLQIFRNGMIESVDSLLLNHNEKNNYIPSILFERDIIIAIDNHMKILHQLGVETPIVIMVSLLGVSGYTMAVNKAKYPFSEERPIDRDILLLPDASVDTYDFDVTQILRPIFNTVWNATGWPKSINYDKDGKWVGH